MTSDAHCTSAGDCEAAEGVRACLLDGPNSQCYGAGVCSPVPPYYHCATYD